MSPPGAGAAGGVLRPVNVGLLRRRQLQLVLDWHYRSKKERTGALAGRS